MEANEPRRSCSDAQHAVDLMSLPTDMLVLVLERLDGCSRACARWTCRRLRALARPPRGGVCQAAAQHGHVSVLRWAMARCMAVPWECVGALAAANGHVDVLQWAITNGAPWILSRSVHDDAGREVAWPHDSICTVAARHGRLNTLQWARANGAPWDDGQSPHPGSRYV